MPHIIHGRCIHCGYELAGIHETVVFMAARGEPEKSWWESGPICNDCRLGEIVGNGMGFNDGWYSNAYPDPNWIDTIFYEQYGED